jgi:tetratricopeptide (TPR) repeat protein
VRFAGLSWLVLAAACTTAPRDPFAKAEHALATGDLAAALQAFDAVPVGHARHAQARSQALAVENRLRRCHELMLQAMRFRAERNDREALAALERARRIWPGAPGAQALVDATNRRLQVAPSRPEAAVAAVAPAVEVAVAEPAPPVAAPAAPVAESAPGERAPIGGNDDIARQLIAVEAQLAGGQLERAVADLLAIARRRPADPRVRSRLARVLHQRALLHYGDGRLEVAIADWRRVLELEPDHAQAPALLQAALLEHR